jgi:hypothetical protein
VNVSNSIRFPELDAQKSQIVRARIFLSNVGSLKMENIGTSHSVSLDVFFSKKRIIVID